MLRFLVWVFIIENHRSQTCLKSFPHHSSCLLIFDSFLNYYRVFIHLCLLFHLDHHDLHVSLNILIIMRKHPLTFTIILHYLLFLLCHHHLLHHNLHDSLNILILIATYQVAFINQSYPKNWLGVNFRQVILKFVVKVEFECCCFMGQKLIDFLVAMIIIEPIITKLNFLILRIIWPFLHLQQLAIVPVHAQKHDRSNHVFQLLDCNVNIKLKLKTQYL